MTGMVAAGGVAVAARLLGVGHTSNGRYATAVRRHNHGARLIWSSTAGADRFLTRREAVTFDMLRRR